MKNKITLALVATLLAFALPASIAADFAGLRLPAALDALHVFSAFVTALLALAVVKDYGPTRPRYAGSTRASANGTPLAPAKAVHALAA